MRTCRMFALAAVWFAACISTPDTPESGDTATANNDGDQELVVDDTVVTPAALRLVWSDEFNGAAGTTINGANWRFETGGGGFGNHELQNYTNRTSNVRQDGLGHLEIVTRAEAFGGNRFTSGRINTSGHFTQRYGRFEARIRVPSGNGIWPAFWALGDNIGSAGWPTCGEVDIMEQVRDFSVNHGTIHGPGYSGAGGITGSFRSPSGSFANDFHIYAIEWQPNEVRWFVDGTMYERRTPANLPPGTRWVFDHPFFLLLNVAVGGDFPGPPDASTRFPQTMVIDYVRVFTL